MTVCGAKTRAGGECQQAAGWGTEHVGAGRCKLHAGNAGRPIIHGRYARYAPAKIAEKLDAFDDADALNLFPELQLQRALIAEYMTRVTDGYRLTAADITFLQGWIDAIGRMAERINKMRNDTALTAAEVAFITARIPDVVMKYIDDPNKQRAFIAELFGITGRARQSAAELESGTGASRTAG